MDTPVVLIQIVGFITLIGTGFSIKKHFMKESKEAKDAPNQSKIELALNTAILYLWFFFIISFSIGMMVNN
jgi:hypothetical protein